jgi:RNA polymerase sigma-70 factor, ECF subfamily
MSRFQEPKSLTDDELASECARRPINESAWSEFWARFYPAIFRQVRRLLAPFGRSPVHSELDDIVQLVFLKVLNSLDRYDPKRSSLRVFLNLLATNVVIDQLRSNRRKRPAFEELERIESSLSSGETRPDVLQGLFEFLDAADPRKRAIIDDFLLGLTTEEICKKHAVSRSAFYTIVYRFRDALRVALPRK